MSSAKPTPDAQDGFLSRWSRRKVQARGGTLEAEAPAAPAAGQSPLAVPTPTGAASGGAPTSGRSAEPAATTGAPSGAVTEHRAASMEAPAAPLHASPPTPPPPTMEDVARLTKDSDYSRFVGRSVDPGVKNAALHKLFADPHFNVMDGLDIYIDDYNRPDPLPAGMLEKMVQSEALGLFTKTPEPADNPATPAASPQAATDAAPGHPPDKGSDRPSDAQPDTSSDASPCTPPSSTASDPASDLSAAFPAANSTDLPADTPRPPSRGQRS